MSTQSGYATRQRSFDYIQRDWLEKTSGRPAHTWDLYVVKELLDNAMDADERWTRDHDLHIEIAVQLTYRSSGSLEVTVCNQAPFPIQGNLLPAIFDLEAYTTDKSHTNYPSRGEQGNALKTLLGIPYALRRELRGDYANIYKPLVIETGGQAYVISLAIDELHQQVRPAPIDPTPQITPHDRTCMKVGVDRFVQERPRTMSELRDWAQRFALFNPHVTFRWRVRIGAQQEDWEFSAIPGWSGLFNDMSPVQWYEYAQLRELLLALEREHGTDMPLPQALQQFAGFDLREDSEGQRAQALCKRLGYQTIGELQLVDHHVITLRDGLWPALLKEGRAVPAEALGGLGEAYLIGALARLFGLESPPIYRRVIHDNPDDSAHPFVLELALGRLPQGQKRVIWTGLNHTPTYEDPFYTRLLYPPVKPEQPVSGLDGFLDAYGQTSEQPVLLVIHIICPNLAYQDFSKTEIDARPFRQPLAGLLHEMLSEFTRVEVVQFEDLQATAHALLPEAVQRLSPSGKQQFAASQLLRAIRRLLLERLSAEGRAEFAATWLSDPGATARLQAYIQTYAQQNRDLLNNLIGPEQGRLSLPVRPDAYTTLPASQVDQRLLEETCVNKLLLVPDPEMESLLIANGLLSRYDMALLCNEDGFNVSFEAVLEHLNRLDLPLVLLHHATPDSCLLAERLRKRLNDAGLAKIQLLDLGLTPAQGRELGLDAEPGAGGGDAAALAHSLEPDEVAFLTDLRLEMSLFALSVQKLTGWLDQRFAEIGLPAKLIPAAGHLRSAGLTNMKRILSDWVISRFHQINQVNFLVDQVMVELAPDLNPDHLPAKLDEALKTDPLQSWTTSWADLVGRQCQDVIAKHEEQIEALINRYTPA